LRDKLLVVKKCMVAVGEKAGEQEVVLLELSCVVMVESRLVMKPVVVLVT
jgi:hypothetical protein